jgi:aspartokinase
MRINFEDGQFNLKLTREELVVVVSALGWTDSLVASDEAFQEYVGCPRERYRLLVRELAEAYRSDPTQEAG